MNDFQQSNKKDLNFTKKDYFSQHEEIRFRIKNGKIHHLKKGTIKGICKIKRALNSQNDTSDAT
jgi:DNA-directed RNA polymerase subunit E'/Rpb7